jgi:dihydrofolate reductase
MNKKPIISLIAALSTNRVIGKENKLPWNLPTDMKYFKKVTSGKPVIMGRKTFDSIGRPLPNRRNIVVTGNPQKIKNKEVRVVKTISKAFLEAEKDSPEEIFIIGGGQIYQQTIDLADKLYLTVVETLIQGDTFFPEYSHFGQVVWEEKHHENGLDFSFLEIERS